MTESNKAQPASPDALAKTSPKGTVELTEAQLADASGGAIYMNPVAVTDHKLESSLKIDVNPGALLPAVKPVG
jgi:hypothetical protein